MLAQKTSREPRGSGSRSKFARPCLRGWTLLLLSLFLGGWPSELAAQDVSDTAGKEPLPLHDLPQLVKNSSQGDRKVPSRRDVVLLKAYDGDPALGRVAEKGLLLRELVRQALLLAAREELGLPTRDATLLETFPAAENPDSERNDAARGSIQIVSSIPGLHPEIETIRVSLFLEKPAAIETLWEKEFATHEKWWHTMEGISNQMEQLSRGEFVAVLKEAGYQGAPNHWLEQASIPDEMRAEASEWDMISQFRFVRSLHSLIRQQGESPERLAALAKAYIRLGTLTDWHWSPAHQVFKARALLYANRLIARTDGSALSRRVRTYVLSLLGRHIYALHVELVSLKKLQPKLTPEMQAFEAFLRFEKERLAELSEDPELRPLIRVLQFLAVEPVQNHVMVNPVSNALLEELPFYYPARAVMAQHSELGTRMAAGAQLIAMLGPSFDSGLKGASDLPPSVRNLQSEAFAKNDATLLDNVSLRKRQAVVSALHDAGTVKHDQVEPSWDCLAQLIREEGFAAAACYIHNQRYMLGLPAQEVDEMIQPISPLLEGHRFEEGLRSYGYSPGKLRQRLPMFLESLDSAEIERTALPMSRHLASFDDSAHPVFAYPAYDHLDLVYRDLVFQIEEGKSWGGKRGTWQLGRISSHAPMRVVGNIIYRSDKVDVARNFDKYEEEYGDHAEVVKELSRLYRRKEDWEAAERVARKLVEVEPTTNAYRELATVYEEQEKTEKWLETLEKSLQAPAHGLSHARARVEIAKHYMNQGEAEKAQPYAEAAAQTWAGWAMPIAVQVYDRLGDLQNAEKWARRTSERYDTAALEWYFWCRRNGAGHVEAAQRLAQERVDALGTPLPDNEIPAVACFHLLADRPEKALAAYRELFAESENSYFGFHAALTAYELGNKELYEKLLQEIDNQGSKVAVDNARAPYVRLAQLLRSAIEQDQPPQIDAQRVETIINSGEPGEPTNLNYFVGKFLWLYGQKDEAQRYLVLAARSPVTKQNRHLAGALLHDHGIDVEPVRHEEIPSE